MAQELGQHPDRGMLSRRTRGLRGPALVGRSDEMALLESEYSRAADGQFRCVLLVGEPGVGKTRLAAELLTRHAGDATWLQARAHPMATTVPFGLWAEALDPHLQVLCDDEVVALCGGFLDDLAGLFHRVAAVRGSIPGGEVPRPRLLGGLACMVAGLAHVAPVVVMLDDVHWADASSWDVLRHLARQLRGAPLLILITARPVELAAHELGAQVLLGLEQDGALTRLDVDALGTAGLAALAEQITGAPAGGRLVDWLAERSQGNPLFAIGLLRALAEEGADLAAPALRRLPESLAQRVTARVRAADPAQQGMLELLAVAGGSLPFGDVVAMSGTEAVEARRLLIELVATRGVIETERGRTLAYELAHPLIREAIYAQIGLTRRRQLHRQAGSTLRNAGRITEAALHYARSADPGDDEAVSVLLDAIREAEAREAVSESMFLLAELVELLPSADRRWLAAFEVMRWDSDWIVDHRADAHTGEAVRALVAIDEHLAAAGESRSQAAVALRLAGLHAWGTGDLAAAREACDRARRLFESLGDRGRALLAARELAFIRGAGGDLAGMEVDADAVAREAETAGERAVEMLALATVTLAAIYRGRFARAAAASERALTIARSDDKSYRVSAGRGMHAGLLALQGDPEEALRELADAKLADPFAGETILAEMEAVACWFAGDYTRALRAAQEGAAAGHGARRRLPGLIFGTLAAIETADPALTQHQLRRASDTLGDRDWRVYHPMVQYAATLSLIHI